VYRITDPFLSLIVAASIWSLPALALDQGVADDWANGDAAGICAVGGDIDHPMLLAAYTGKSPDLAGARSSRAHANLAPSNALDDPGADGAGRNSADHGTTGMNTAGQNTAGNMDSQPGPHPRSSPGAGEVPPHTVLSLFHQSPRPPQVAARTVGDEQQGDWMRTSENKVPEPGLWAVLIAGFLGVCAMARPRIFSS
jgi:hypothetical protein